VEGVAEGVASAFEDHRRAVDGLQVASSEAIIRAAEACADCVRGGGTLLFCGNGGSAADAQHLAAEFVGRYMRERAAWPAIALSTNSSAVTAIGNDYGFDEVFARQVEAHGKAGDVLVAISTSGDSADVLRAMDVAREREITIVAMTGRDGGKMGMQADIHINVPSQATPRIQEGQIIAGHVLCALVEESLCERP
jgi:D-sedoheptulose 7-phosphate isomerase